MICSANALHTLFNRSAVEQISLYLIPLDCSSLVISDTDTGNEADEEEALHEKRKHQVLYITGHVDWMLI